MTTCSGQQLAIRVVDRAEWRSWSGVGDETSVNWDSGSTTVIDASTRTIIGWRARRMFEKRDQRAGRMALEREVRSAFNATRTRTIYSTRVYGRSRSVPADAPLTTTPCVIARAANACGARDRCRRGQNSSAPRRTVRSAPHRRHGTLTTAARIVWLGRGGAPVAGVEFYSRSGSPLHCAREF